MHQLNLFGLPAETPAKKEKPEDQVLADLQKDHISAGKALEKHFFPLVSVTGEIPRQNDQNRLQKTIEQAKPETEFTDLREHKTAYSSFEDEIDNDNISSSNKTETLQIEFTEDEDDIAELEITNEQKEQKQNDFLKKGEIMPDEKSEVSDGDKKPVTSARRKITTLKEPPKRGRKSLEEIDAEADLIDVPEDEVLFKKQYYPISEVAKWFRVNTSLLRFWENEFDILKPKKNRKGDRLFRPEDVKNLQLIYQLLRQRKYTIEGAKEYLKTNKKKADVELQLATTLQKFRSFLLYLKANLE